MNNSSSIALLVIGLLILIPFFTSRYQRFTSETASDMASLLTFVRFRDLNPPLSGLAIYLLPIVLVYLGVSGAVLSGLVRADFQKNIQVMSEAIVVFSAVGASIRSEILLYIEGNWRRSVHHLFGFPQRLFIAADDLAKKLSQLFATADSNDVLIGRKLLDGIGRWSDELDKLFKIISISAQDDFEISGTRLEAMREVAVERIRASVDLMESLRGIPIRLRS